MVNACLCVGACGIFQQIFIKSFLFAIFQFPIIEGMRINEVWSRGAHDPTKQLCLSNAE